MGWHIDATGLEVYRNRGRTVLQKYIQTQDYRGWSQTRRWSRLKRGGLAQFARGPLGPKYAKEWQKTIRCAIHGRY